MSAQAPLSPSRPPSFQADCGCIVNKLLCTSIWHRMCVVTIDAAAAGAVERPAGHLAAADQAAPPPAAVQRLCGCCREPGPGPLRPAPAPAPGPRSPRAQGALPFSTVCRLLLRCLASLCMLLMWQHQEPATARASPLTESVLPFAAFFVAHSKRLQITGQALLGLRVRSCSKCHC